MTRCNTSANKNKKRTNEGMIEKENDKIWAIRKVINLENLTDKMASYKNAL